MNGVQNIPFEIWEYKAVRKYKKQPGKVSTSSFDFVFCTKLVINYIKEARYI